ncbi:MAG TPA: winged helix family transcriptional regulator [Chloroflexi bacterium]|nr:winged helix family transcriptional regulator [Chloroflexota bacterium]
MSQTYGFSRRLGRWLETFGFIDDPFALYEADQERALLHFFFIDRPYVHDVLGDPSRPQAAFLMAGRGAGKTATREIVAYECTHTRFRRRALAVRYYDFSPILSQVEGNLDTIDVRHHVRLITRYTLKALAEDVPPTYFDLLTPRERGLLVSCARAFADPISALALGEILSDEAIPLDWETFTPLETLNTVAQLVTRLGQSPDARYEALYILVDRVDETLAGPSAAIPLLAPLVSQGPLLETAHVAFKFFLPIEVGARLRQVVTLRPDRLRFQTITWDEQSLRKMVKERLIYYSDERVSRLEDLCLSSIKSSVMERLIRFSRASEGSPRTLLRLCQSLIHHHVAQADPTNPLITYTDLIDTLRDFEHQLEAERTIPPLTKTDRTAPTSRAAATAAAPQEGLYLDESGHVWVDGQSLTSVLSPNEFRLLETLYKSAPEIVTHQALIEAIWSSPNWVADEKAREMDEQNLRKLIARLRERLPGGQTRFIKNVRGRGYWLKTA